MGQGMTLGDVLSRLVDLNGEDTIYASEPWTVDSEALVMQEPSIGGLPFEVQNVGMKYFLEIGIAQDFVEDLIASLSEPQASSAIYQRVINYAINDA